MKKIILIGSKNSEGKNDVRRLSDSFNTGKTSTGVVFWEDLLFDITRHDQKVIDAVSGTDLKAGDLIIAVNWYKTGSKAIYRDVAYALALYLRRQKIEFWNAEMGNQRSTTKLSAMMQLALAGYDIPATLFSLTPGHLLNRKSVFPMIVKGATASRGHDNFLISDSGELAAQLGKDEVNHYLLEEFIPNDSDLRVICIGGEPGLVIRRRRVSQATHLNNTSQGAKAELVPLENLPAELKEDCRKICQLMGREMAGIDILEANDASSRKVFLEVNAVPQLTSGTFVDEKLTAISSAVNNYLERQD